MEKVFTKLVRLSQMEKIKRLLLKMLILGDVYQLLEQEESLQVTVVRRGQAFRLEVNLES